MASVCVPYKHSKISSEYLLYDVVFKDDNVYKRWNVSGIGSGQKTSKEIENIQGYFEKLYYADIYPGKFAVNAKVENIIDPEYKNNFEVNEQTPSVLLGLFLTAAQHVQRLEFRNDWQVICATGDLKYNNETGRFNLFTVGEIQEKFQQGVRKHAKENNQNYLFLYISKDKPVQEGEYGNITVKRFSPDNKIEDILREVFKPVIFDFDFTIKSEANPQEYIFETEQQNYIEYMKNQNEHNFGYVKGEGFDDNLTSEMSYNSKWPGFFLYGNIKGCGKSTTAMMVASYLTWIKRIYAPIWIDYRKPDTKKVLDQVSYNIEETEDYFISFIADQIIQNENCSEKELTLVGKKNFVKKTLTNTSRKYLIVVDNLELHEKDVNNILKILQKLFSGYLPQFKPYVLITNPFKCDDQTEITTLGLLTEKIPKLNDTGIEQLIVNIAKGKGSEWENKINKMGKNDINRLVKILFKKCGDSPRKIIKAIQFLDVIEGNVLEFYKNNIDELIEDNIDISLHKKIFACLDESQKNVLFLFSKIEEEKLLSIGDIQRDINESEDRKNTPIEEFELLKIINSLCNYSLIYKTKHKGETLYKKNNVVDSLFKEDTPHSPLDEAQIPDPKSVKQRFTPLLNKLLPKNKKVRYAMIGGTIAGLIVLLLFFLPNNKFILWQQVRIADKNVIVISNSRSNPTPLTDNQWVNGYISSYGDGAEHWYSFSVIKGTRYYIWSNDRNDKEQEKIDVKITASYSNGEAIFFNGSLLSFEAISNDTVNVNVKVNPYLDILFGAYDVAYSTSSKRPDWIRPANTKKLVKDSWQEGNIVRNGEEHWYLFSVKKGKQYYIWKNDGLQGNGNKTLIGRIRIYYKNGNQILDLKDNPNFTWDAPLSFTAGSNDTVYVCVSGEGFTGTYGVIYRTSNVTPGWINRKSYYDSKLLEAGIWKDDSITTSVQSPSVASVGEVWYSFSVAGGKEYYIWLNNMYQGNGSKRGLVCMSAFYSNGVSIFDHVISAWNTPKSFTPPSSIDKVYVRIFTSIGDEETNTYGVAYSTSGIRPEWNYPSKPIPLTANRWEEGNITNPDDERLYEFSVTEGKKYYIWVVNGKAGDGTKGFIARVSALYSGGNSIFTNDYLLKSPRSFTANSSDKVYVRVLPYSSGGTYDIVYSNSSIRPNLLGWKPPPKPNKLTANKWEVGNITDPKDESWYKFSVTNGEKYYIWLNDWQEGDGSKTLNAEVSIFYSNGDCVFHNVYSAWNSPLSFTAGSEETVYIQVSSLLSSGGSYGIIYRNQDTRPYWNPPSGDTLLTDKQWGDGHVFSPADERWYSFSVTRGTRYYIWLNSGYEGDGTKTLTAKVSALYDNGKSIFCNRIGLWNASWAFDADSTGRVYVYVSPYSSDDTGIYGVVYSTNSKRPSVP